LQIFIPIKHHKHFKELQQQGTQLKGIRISKKSISVSFEIPKQIKTHGKKIGIDIGMKTAFTSSDGKYGKDSVNYPPPKGSGLPVSTSVALDYSQVLHQVHRLFP